MLFRFVVLVNSFNGGWLVVVTDIPWFIHVYIHCTTLREKLYECFGWFIIGSIGVSSTINHQFPWFLTVIACGNPQLVLLLSVTYRQLKGKQMAQCIAGKFSTLLEQICKRNQVGDELSDANSMPHRLVNPNQYNRSLLSDTEQTRQF